MRKLRHISLLSGLLLLISLPLVGHGQHGCIDPTNLSSSYVRGYYGTFNNPYNNVGIIDLGSASSGSRHTVHTSSSERDPRTNNLLPTVPPGSSASVRLGNWESGANAEALRYTLVVDTLVSDLLILKYAAVLQNPNHPSSRQPRFRLEILDAYMNVIDPLCGVSDFIANSSLGWNTVGSGSNTVLWKNWTSVGIDLSPYAGQTIYIRLTTYDCADGGHYGYAYFTLECARKSIQSLTCGPAAANSFTVPEGFSYRWYTDTLSQAVISTARTLYTTGNETDNLFYCRLSFLDKPGCYFTMNAYAGDRYPLALFDTVVTHQTCGYNVSFLNRSRLSADGATPLPGGEGCETSLWDFGDGSSSSQYHTSHYYEGSGDYTVTLISGLANNACTDTTQMTLHLPALDTVAHIVGPSTHCLGYPPETLRIIGAQSSSWPGNTLQVSPSEPTTYQATVVDSRGCTMSLRHSVDTLHSTSSSVADTVLENLLPVSYHGQVFNSDVSHATVVFPNAAGCDSVVDYSLLVRWNVTVEVDTAVCANELPLSWGRLTFTDAGTLKDTLPNEYGADSVVVMTLKLHPIYDDTLRVETCQGQEYIFGGNIYTATGIYTDSLLTNESCDSLSTLDLLVHPAPTVEITPDTLCPSEQYLLHFHTQAPYTRWSSSPHDPLLDRHLHDTALLVAPSSPTTYTALADIYEEGLCPVTGSLTLDPLVAVHPQLKVIPEALSIDHLHLDAYDISHNNEPRAWYIDGLLQPTTDYFIHHLAPWEADSVVIALEHYNDQCRDTAVMVIPVFHTALFPPNIFTPLQDNNNRFTIPSTDILDGELLIYNRAGLLLFSTSDFRQGWDGRDSSGTLCPQGAYVWHLHYHSADHPQQYQTAVGTVLLLR